MTTLLIDADVLVYRAAFAAQHNMYQVQLTGEEGYVASFRYKKEVNQYLKDVGLEERDYTLVVEQVVEPVQNALYSAKHMLESMLKKFTTKDYRLFLTGKDNYRMKIAPYYKANRTQPKPVHYEAMRTYLIDAWGAIVVDGQEADDAMGIDQWEDFTKCRTFHPEDCTDEVAQEIANTIICTNDKDLNTIPGWHYDFTKPDSNKVWVDSEYATWFFYKQLLMGDATDNIKGVRGIGSVGADNILSGCYTEGDMYTQVAVFYQLQYCKDCKTEEGNRRAIKFGNKMLLENARLIYIRKQEGELWQPPK